MKIRLLRGIGIGFAVLLLILNQGVAAAQGGGARLFEQTGHWVTGEFLVFYESIPNAMTVYGNPITAAFDSNLSKDPAGSKIQYFEKARFELHPENPPGLRVTLTLLGEYFLDRDVIDTSIKSAANPSACRNIPHDGLPVCYSFLHFFDRQGGIVQFGYPISELVFYEGGMVQYFQRARFEWHHELPNGQKVSLSDIGLEYFYAIKEDPRLLQLGKDPIPANQAELHISAFVKRAVMPPNGLQEVYVAVRNQYFQPVSGAHVTIHVDFPSGDTRDFSMPLTNSNGISQVSFIVQDQPVGLVHIIVNVRTSDQHLSSNTSFRIWK